MSALLVTPLSQLAGVVRSSGALDVISLAGPGRLVDPLEGVERWTAVTFNDIAEPRDGLVAPQRSHVEAIFEAVDAWSRERPLVVQCWFGVSRSTAAALAIATRERPQADMGRLAGTLRRLAPWATPNAAVIAHADDLVGLGGRLREAVAAIGRGSETSEGAPFTLRLDQAPTKG